MHTIGYLQLSLKHLHEGYMRDRLEAYIYVLINISLSYELSHPLRARMVVHKIFLIILLSHLIPLNALNY